MKKIIDTISKLTKAKEIRDNLANSDAKEIVTSGVKTGLSLIFEKYIPIFIGVFLFGCVVSFTVGYFIGRLV